MVRLLVLLSAVTLTTLPVWAEEESATERRDKAPSPMAIRGDHLPSLRVGQGSDGRIVVATNQVLSPAGRQVKFAGRPTDAAISPNGKWLAVLSRDEVLLLDLAEGTIASRAKHPHGSYAGIAFMPDGGRVIASSGGTGSLGVFKVDGSGKLAPDGSISLPRQKPLGPQPGAGQANALPIGLALRADGERAWIVLNLRNALAEVDLTTRKVIREIPVGNAPYGIVGFGAKAYVSNWAGRHPGPDDPQGPGGAGTPVRVDPVRNIASDGTVSVVDLAAGKEIKQIPAGLHPSGLAATPDGRYVCVANASSDTISVIDTGRDEVVETISTRPGGEKQLFGSAPNALCFSADGRTLYVANGGANAVGVIDFQPLKSRLRGSIPVGYYPAAVRLDSGRRQLAVVNVKGIGARNTDWRGRRKIKNNVVFGFNSHDYEGSVSLVPLPQDAELKGMSAQVGENNRLSEQLSALAPPRADAHPRPVPERHGEPSVFKHVLYIIKENRTYDQVFGDIQRGEGDESLCMYGAEVTPNQHKLAEEFVLLDNFYCNGSLSADGHQWATQSYVTDYLEKAFGGWPRGYPFDGGDAMAYASSGFLWDNALKHRRTLRVYGEFVSAEVRWKDPARETRPTFMECYRDYVDGTGLISIRATADIKTIQPYLCATTIGFPSIVSDQYRASEFIREWKGFEKRGELPNLMILLLPNDHTAGTTPGMPTPEAAVADNDLAVGRIVEAVSHSRFWPETCIFVVEDDPQAGFDHIDGRRTIAQAISPYTRRGAVVSTNYNQSSMIRTIELILGLPPMNQFDAAATPMTACFVDKPDPKPYKAVPTRIPLDTLNPRVAEISDPRQRHWAEVSLRLPLTDVDEADEDTLNRILWHAARGRDDTYPSWAVLPEERTERDDD